MYSISVEQKWLAALTDDDLEFIHQFILASGSLKQLASYYGVSYPTIRNRADRLIERVRLSESEEQPYVAFVKSMAMEGKITMDAAKELIMVFRALMEKKQ